METVRYGSRGNAVLLLQLALKRQGAYKGELDGIFGTRTLNAVRRLQTASGLKPDGVAGPNTWDEAEKYLYGFVSVRLRPGDTFFRLARRYGVTTETVAAANPDLDPANLPVGGEVIIPLRFPVVPADVPYSSLLLEYVVRGLTVRYPFIGLETLGHTALGNPIRALKMGTGRAEVFINAAHHANEWITAPLVLDFLESYARAYVEKGTVSGRSANAFYAATTLYIAPMVDPDGVDLVNGAASREAFAEALKTAEDYPNIPFPEGWKANIEGTDLNLNYPADWETAREIKFAQGFTGPAPRDFVGEAPLSAKESRAIFDFTKKHSFALTVSYHTQGEEIYWKFKDIEPEGAREIGETMSAVSGYTLADVPYESGFAGYKDWFILEYGRPGFTVEAGRGRNPLPLSAYDGIRQDNFPLMAAALEAAEGRAAHVQG